MKSIKILFSITLIGVWACSRDPGFGAAPEISFLSAQKFVVTSSFLQAKQDSVVIAVRFQDGDGDLGISPNEFDEDTTLAKIFNYEVKTFRKISGVFKDITNDFPVSNSGNFPRLRTDKKIGPIEGTLERSLLFPHPFVPKRDTLRFRIRIRDRAGNTSNEIDTEPVVINQ